MSNNKKLLSSCGLFLAACVLALTVRAESGELKTYYERPGLNLNAYDKILVDPLALSNAKVVPPPWVEGKDRQPHKWALNQDDINYTKQAYRAAMQQQLETEGGYAIVAEPGEGVLEIAIAIVSLTPYAQQGEQVITKGSGELTMQVELRDALSRELLAIYEGNQEVGHEYQENTRLSAEHNLQQLFAEWGKKVRDAMDADHGK